MKITLITIILTAIFAATSEPGAGTSRGILFPTVEGSDLEGREYAMPGDFEGDLNLVLVAFQREQQEDVDTWLDLARELESSYEGFRYYELPTIYKANKAFQWFINNGMRRGIKDKTARERTITLYLDKAKFRKALNLPHEGQIYALLVNGEGEVIWRADGRNSKAKRLDLEKNISKILNRVVETPSESI